jgi:hypothetical protein
MKLNSDHAEILDVNSKDQIRCCLFSFLESDGLEWPTNNGPLSLYVKQYSN